jgi:hypothetical protein
MSADDRTRQDEQYAEAMLRAEISFWREMIESCDSSEPFECVERMNHAKALAEFRLAKLSTGRPGRTSSHRDNPIH